MKVAADMRIQRLAGLWIKQTKTETVNDSPCNHAGKARRIARMVDHSSRGIKGNTWDFIFVSVVELIWFCFEILLVRSSEASDMDSGQLPGVLQGTIEVF